MASQDGDSCTDFDYCLDGDYISESCTPGQYFDVEIRKSLIHAQFVVVLPIYCYFKVVVFQLMIYHVVLHVQIPAQSTHDVFITQQESQNALLLSTKMDMMIALLLHTVSMAIMLKKNVPLANTSMLRSVSDNLINKKFYWTSVSLFTRSNLYLFSRMSTIRQCTTM